nr:DUF4058 family protein [Leptolyngbya sp. FACHB-671]
MTPSFPGMNPYLENPSLWSEVHSWLIVELAPSLNLFPFERGVRLKEFPLHWTIH